MEKDTETHIGSTLPSAPLILLADWGGGGGGRGRDFGGSGGVRGSISTAIPADCWFLLLPAIVVVGCKCG